MKVSERMILKDRLKKLGIFCLIVFIPVLVLSVVLAGIHVEPWLNVLVLVVVLFLLFFLYAYICEKLDKKKQERLSKKKDPFSD